MIDPGLIKPQRARSRLDVRSYPAARVAWAAEIRAVVGERIGKDLRVFGLRRDSQIEIVDIGCPARALPGQYFASISQFQRQAIVRSCFSKSWLGHG
jgi:hypothetical protein